MSKKVARTNRNTNEGPSSLQRRVFRPELLKRISAAKSNPKKIVPMKPKKGRGSNYEDLPVLGYQLFPDLKSSIYISASTKSGKTTLISHIIKHCAGRQTKLYFFCSTMDLDPTYKLIFDYLDSAGIEYEKYHHFIDDDGVNIIDGIIQGLSHAEEPEEKVSLQSPPPAFYKLVNGFMQKVDIYGNPIETNAEEPGQEESQTPVPYIEKHKIDGVTRKYQVPRYMFIFDDLGDELRKKSIYQLLMRQRQYIAKTILSSQYINNLTPQSINQLDYCIIYGGHNIEQIKELHKKLDLSLDLAEFVRLYSYATAEKYNFLWIDRRNMVLKKNFDEVLYSKG